MFLQSITSHKKSNVIKQKSKIQILQNKSESIVIVNLIYFIDHLPKRASPFMVPLRTEPAELISSVDFF